MGAYFPSNSILSNDGKYTSHIHTIEKTPYPITSQIMGTLTFPTIPYTTCIHKHSLGVCATSQSSGLLIITCTHRDTKKAKSKSEPNVLGDLQPMLCSVFNVAILGTIGFPPTMPLEETIWHSAVCCSCSTTSS